MALPASVTLVEVGPRDGLQNEKIIVPQAIKIEWIKQLIHAGLTVIEATSFVSPKWVPQLSDALEVMHALMPFQSVRFPVLIPNIMGLKTALQANIKDIAVFTTVSETFSRKNTNCTVAEGVKRIEEIVRVAKDKQLRIRGYISCVIACPYEGPMASKRVAELTAELLSLGCDEISLGDTIGVGTLMSVRTLLDDVLCRTTPDKLAVHFHDTYGQALVNIYEALQYGISVIDSSTSGLGGCPYAPLSSGNVATEDVVYMLHGLGITTGVDLEKLTAAGRYIVKYLNKETQSRVNRAMF